MKYIIIFYFLICTSIVARAQTPSQKLLLVGGGKRPEAALSKWADLTRDFTQQNRKSSGKVLVITWASSISEEVFLDLKLDLEKPGLEVHSSLRGPVTALEKKELLEQIANSSGIFFSGGDQNKIFKVFEDAEILDAIKQAYWERGMPFAGTSAGTAIMSEVMILGDNKPLGKGLGFLPHSVVDQHFLKRNRVDRLLTALKEAPAGFIGVGVEEDGAILWENSKNPKEFKGTVLGDKQVMIIQPLNEGEINKKLLNPNQSTSWKIIPAGSSCDELVQIQK